MAVSTMVGNMGTDERLFAFVRASDGTPMAVDLRFNGESFGWEVRLMELLEDVEEAVLFASRGGFVTRAEAVQWAEDERKDLEKGGA